MNAHAALWGRKAAREGLPVSSNPYRTPEDRQAWLKGHNEESAQRAKMKELT